MTGIIIFCLTMIFGMLLVGKIFDVGSPTDDERVIYPEGPECDEDEDLAEICSPFYCKSGDIEFDSGKEITLCERFELEEKSESKENEHQLPSGNETMKYKEVQLSELQNSKCK